MIDPFTSILAPMPALPDDIVPVVPSDSANLTYDGQPVVAIGLRAGTAGTIRVLTRVGTTRTITFSAGQALGLPVVRVFATGTTATGIEMAVKL